jgi:hypothetical protein
MNANHEIDPQRAAQIEHRIAQAFDFAIDVVKTSGNSRGTSGCLDAWIP